MSFKTKDPDATPWWARRRVLGSALAITAIVASGAAAQASANGDGFLNRPASSSSASSSSSSSSGSWNWNGSGYSWNGSTWVWSGTGANRYAFSAVANPATPTLNQLLGINDQGYAVGYSGSGSGYMMTPSGRYHTVSFPHARKTHVAGVNNAGQTVGSYVDSHGRTFGFVQSGGHYWSVGYRHARSTQLLGINNRGIAVGFFVGTDGHKHGFTYNIHRRAFVIIVLPVRATNIVVTAINNRGTVVGFIQHGRVTQAFILAPNVFILVNLGHHTNTRALGINNAGQVVGSYVDKHGRTVGFVWINRNTVRVIIVPTATVTIINGINNRGVIIGIFTTTRNRTLGFMGHQ